MASAVLGGKGQISVEFILIIVIGLIYVYMTVWPLINDATAAAEDVQRVSDAKIAAQKLADSLNEAAAGSGDSKRTIHLLVPSKAEIECDFAANQVKYTVDVNRMYERRAPVHSKCTTVTDALGNEWFECSSGISVLSSISSSMVGTCPAMEGPLHRAVVVEKTSGEISVSWAS